MCEYCGCQSLAAIDELTREHDVVVNLIGEVVGPTVARTPTGWQWGPGGSRRCWVRTLRSRNMACFP